MLCHVTLSYTVLCSQAGETALHVTARYGYPDVLAFLCQSGAKLNIQDNVGPQASLLLSHSTLISPSSPYHLSLSSSPLLPSLPYALFFSLPPLLLLLPSLLPPSSPYFPTPFKGWGHSPTVCMLAWLPECRRVSHTGWLLAASCKQGGGNSAPCCCSERVLRYREISLPERGTTGHQ